MYYSSLENFKALNGYVIDGIWYPRVTAIVSIKAKPALYKFYADQTSFAAADAIKNKSAEEGTLIHETIEAILKGESPSIPDPVAPVTRIVSKKHHYAGTLDCLAEVNGELGVLDIKTSQAVYRDYGIQTAAYVEALREDPSMPPLKRWILRLDQTRYCIRGCGAKMREKGGNFKIITASNQPNSCPHVWGEIIGEVELRELPNFEKDIRAFLAAKELWEWEHDYWLNQIF